MKLKEIIFESLLLFEDEKHIRQLFTSWAKKKSGNPELAMSLIDDFFKYKKNIKRDFASFSSAEEMAQAIEKVKSSEQEKIKATDADKIYEDDKILVVATKTHEASCRYAAGTKWCTGAADTDEYWKRHNRMGTEFIWILRGLKQDNPNYKFSLHFKWSKNNNKMMQSPSQKFDSDWCNAQNSCSSRIPNTLLTILGEDSFDNIFDKCMNYHEKRSQERSTQPISDLKEKFIAKVKAFFEGPNIRNLYYIFYEVVRDLDFHYAFPERLQDFGIEDFDEREIDDVYELFMKEVENKEREILTRVSNIISDDVEMIDEGDLQDDYEYLTTSHPEEDGDKIIEDMAYNYLNDQEHEIYFEELSMFMEEFIEDWIRKNYDV